MMSKMLTFLAFGVAVPVLETAAVEAEPSWLSADGCRLYLRYKASANGRSTIFVATRPN